MRKELDDKLVKKYPKIFADRYGDKRETCMCWGFSCGDGWYWLIDQLCSNLQWNTDQNNKNGEYPQVVASQVKEKFGGLCFYVKSATPEQYAQIHFAESMSRHICESCGTTKNLGQTSGWIKVLCEDCSKDQKHPWKKNEED